MYFDESNNEVRHIDTSKGVDEPILSHQQAEAIKLLLNNLKEDSRKGNEQIHKKCF